MIVVAWVCFINSASPVAAAEAVLRLSFGKLERSFSQSQLLARGDTQALEIQADVAYGRAMTYMAVPLLSLLGSDADGFDTIEARATDGFVSQIPRSLVTKSRTGGSSAWIAVEEPRKQWPRLPKKTSSAGPFFLVWQHPERSKIGPEQWPYALASLSGVRSPERRWPQMAVAAALPATAPARQGLSVFVKHCLSCHKINGAGEASIGPDLARPMSPTEYMTENGLRQLIRDPSRVRSWPEQKMAGFDTDVLSDTELGDLIAYLGHMAKPR